MKGRIDYKVVNNRYFPIGDTSGAKTLAHWCGSDIQFSLKALDEWLAAVKAVATESGKPGYLGTGNVMSVSATTTLVYIESEFTDSHKVCLTHDEVIDALSNYRKYVADRNTPPQGFDVSYIAEEDQAFSAFEDAGGQCI